MTHLDPWWVVSYPSQTPLCFVERKIRYGRKRISWSTSREWRLRKRGWTTVTSHIVWDVGRISPSCWGRWDTKWKIMKWEAMKIREMVQSRPVNFLEIVPNGQKYFDFFDFFSLLLNFNSIQFFFVTAPLSVVWANLLSSVQQQLGSYHAQQVCHCSKTPI